MAAPRGTWHGGGCGIAAACGDTHNALPLALIYLASAIQRLSQCQQDTGHGARHNEPLHQARELRIEARAEAEAEAGAASLEALALLVLCAHCAAIALVICSSRDFNALTRSSKSRGEGQADEMKRQS